MIFWSNITRLGDSYILFPIAFMLACWLMAGRSIRLSIYWCVLFGSAMVLVVASKLAFIGWGIGIKALDFTCISGHASRVGAVLPVLFYFILQSPPRKVASFAVLAGACVALLIAISRIVVHAHSVSEMVSGLILGLAVSSSFLWIADRQSVEIKRRWLILPSLLFFLMTPVAKPAPTEQWLTSVALYISGHDKPFDRSVWGDSRN